jgi:citrate synthase
VSYIDGDRGILRYRGYPIEQLAERSNFLEARASSSSSSRAGQDRARQLQFIPKSAWFGGWPALFCCLTLCLLTSCLPCLLQVSYLVTYGSLPNPEQSKRWTEAVMRHSGERVSTREGRGRSDVALFQAVNLMLRCFRLIRWGVYCRPGKASIP